MICTYYNKRTRQRCGGCGTIWINNILVDCPRCGGTGEERKGPPTYSPPPDEEAE